jgi:gliding motility-associated-like protein
VKRTRIVILFLLLLNFVIRIEAQPLPSACTESWVRYAATPDTTWKISDGFLSDTSANYSYFKWFIKGDYSQVRYHGNGNDTIDIHWGRNPGIYKLGLNEVSMFGCTGDTIWTTIEVKGALLDLGSDIEKCAGESYEFDAGGGFKYYNWNNTDSLNASRYFAGIAQKTDTVTVEGTNIDNCKSRDTAILIVHPLPKIAFTADGKDTSHAIVVCENQKLIIGAGNDGLFYNWSTNENSPTIIVGTPLSGEPEKISVEVTSEFNCKSVDSIIITACAPTIPSGFTPNGDQWNPTWDIPYLKYFPEATIDVYDRWGNLVFHCDHGYNKPWDGRVNGVLLPTDSYIYIIKQSSKAAPIVGHVTIMHPN